MKPLLCSILSVFLMVGAAAALPLELVWEPVTTNIAGELLEAPPSYRVYRQTSLDPFKPIATTKNRRWTWLTPSIGSAQYYVTAFNETGESAPSNTITVVVDRVPRMVPPATIVVPPVP